MTGVLATLIIRITEEGVALTGWGWFIVGALIAAIIIGGS